MNASCDSPCFDCGTTPTLPLGPQPNGHSNHVPLCIACSAKLDAAVASYLATLSRDDDDDLYEPTAEDYALRAAHAHHTF